MTIFLLKLIRRINGAEHLTTELKQLTAEVHQLRAQLNESNEQLRNQLRESNASVLAVTESHHKWAAESARQIVKIHDALSILERAQKTENRVGGVGDLLTEPSDRQP